VPDERYSEARIEQLPVRGDQRKDQSTEGDEHEPMRSADLGPLQHSGMPEGFSEHMTPAVGRMITSSWSGSAELDDVDDRCNGADKEHDADNRDGQRHEDRGDFHVRLLLEGNYSLG
jgi:hypothetical protein